ncbi:MAG: TlpA disulfide reductase family protein, partial [Actinomycetota bacterium]|nr:TlpA disulfide reductase family protein [Actinomycetota bacterium]
MEQMTSRSKLFGLVSAISIVAAACSVSAAVDAPGGASQQDAEIAPMFTVPTADGGEFSLAEHLANDGRPIFLNLWAWWCYPCREEMPDIDRT